jgi:hypothetical protein
MPLANGSTVDAQQAVVTLAEIPFVSLRSLLPARMQNEDMDFTTLVRAAASGLAEPRLVVDVKARQLLADGRLLTLAPWQFALMALLAWRRQRAMPPLPPPKLKTHNPEWAAEVLQQMRQALGNMNLPGAVEKALLGNDVNNSTVAPNWTRLRAELTKQLGQDRPIRYLSDGGATKHRQYHVPLPPQAIEFRAITKADCKLANSAPDQNPADTAAP